MSRSKSIAIQWILDPKLLIRAALYVTGLKQLRLVKLRHRPEAKYRALVVGLEEELWSSFDSAFPEFEKTFARQDARIAEMRIALMRQHMALFIFDGAAIRRVNSAKEGLDCTVFYASPSPLPILAKDGVLAYGYTIDSVGRWLEPRRPVEANILLENFDFNNRDILLADGASAVASLKLPPPDKSVCLLVPDAPSIKGASLEDELQKLSLAADQTVPGAHHHSFIRHISSNWFSREVIQAFVQALKSCDTVVAGNSPLGFIALLSGRKVIVTGEPFWAGFGLTIELHNLSRKRSLSIEQMASLILFIISRYVDEHGTLIDPADEWKLPDWHDRLSPESTNQPT